MAEGFCVIERLEEIAGQLGKKGMENNWQKDVLQKLKVVRRYFKGDYKLHLSWFLEALTIVLSILLVFKKVLSSRRNANIATQLFLTALLN